MSKRWGTPTWYFFHTFAEKITENLFNNNRQECLELLHSICIVYLVRTVKITLETIY